MNQYSSTLGRMEMAIRLKSEGMPFHTRRFKEIMVGWYNRSTNNGIQINGSQNGEILSGFSKINIILACWKFVVWNVI